MNNTLAMHHYAKAMRKISDNLEKMGPSGVKDLIGKLSAMDDHGDPHKIAEEMTKNELAAVLGTSAGLLMTALVKMAGVYDGEA